MRDTTSIVILGLLLEIVPVLLLWGAWIGFSAFTDRRRAAHRRIRRSTPIVCVALGLIVPGLVLGRTARADGPAVDAPASAAALPPAAPASVPSVAPAAAAPDLAAKLVTLQADLDRVKAQYGVPAFTPPASFWDGTAGKVIIGISAASSLVLTGAEIYVQLR